MNTVLVWVLVVAGGYGDKPLVFSHPMADLKSCQRLQKEVQGFGNHNSTQCVQIRIVK